MTNMKIVTLITFILMVSVALLHGMSYLTKLVIGILLFAAWLIFAIGRTAQKRRRTRQRRDDV